MDDSEEIISRVLEQLPLLTNKFAPEGEFWLTLYLDGHPDNYADARPALHALGWVSLCEKGVYSGFVYPKKEILNLPAQVSRMLAEALSVCEETGMNIGLIDADTALDPSVSNFSTLYKSK